MKVFAALVLLPALAFVQPTVGRGLLVEFNQDLVTPEAVTATKFSDPTIQLRPGEVLDDGTSLLAAEEVNVTAIKFSDPDIQLREGEVLDNVNTLMALNTNRAADLSNFQSLLASHSAARAMPWAFARQDSNLDGREMAAANPMVPPAGVPGNPVGPPPGVPGNPVGPPPGVPANPPAQVGTPCSDASAVPTGPKVKVLIAISNCISESSTYRPDIEGWIANIQKQDARYFDGDSASEMEFVRRSVDDQCSYYSETIPRLEGETQANYVAVISITWLTKMYYTVKNYASVHNIPTLIQFELAPIYYLPGVIGAPWTSYGYMGQFDPFTISRKIHCKTLPGAIPTSYVDPSGNRKCFCSCPVGYTLQSGSCQPIVDDTCFCAWGQATAGYTFEVKGDNADKYAPSGTCSIKNLAIKNSVGLLPVPVAIDNYVDHIRTNDGDAANPLGSTSPHIELQKKKMTMSVKQGAAAPAVVEQGDANGLTTPFTWKAFQTASTAKIDALEFTSVGRYSIELKARDYSVNEATCEGCVLVLDKRRPTINPLATCPTSVGSVTSELTLTNLATAQTKVNGIQAVKDNALNDPCSPNVRCDADSYATKTFTQADYGVSSASLSGASTFFTAATVKTDLSTRLAGSPFDNAKPDGIATTVSTGACTRCAKLSTQLKEWWTPYTCAANSATSECAGDAAQKCDLEQCVTVDGTTVATTTAALKSTVKSASLVVVKAKPGNDAKTDAQLTSEFSLDAKVHVALECDKYQSLLADDEDTQISPSVCTYSSKVADLIDVAALKKITAGVTDSLFTDAEVESFVNWRYRIDQNTWTNWGATAPSVTFSKYQTAITVEAWTQCGKVHTYTFYVVLHLNNEIKVCENFDNMWYQTSHAPLRVSPNQYCMYPKSDFAELTFDYHPNIGLAFDTDKFHMSISRVQCELKYDGVAAAAVLDTDTFSAPKSFQVVKQFAIDGVDVQTTKAETKLSATCVFTYSRKPDTAKVIQSCSRSFSIIDCAPPAISKPCALDGKCDFNQCAKAEDPRPDLYQSCGGNRVSQSTATGATTFTDVETTCCPSCQSAYFVPTCTQIGENPAGADSSFKFIKRCEAKATVGGLQLEAEMMAEQEAVGGAATSSMTMSLLGASALVAVVALVAVHRRRAGAKVVIEDDAYYPLMA